MKKIRLLGVFACALLLALVATGCAGLNISQKFADKVNDKAKNSENYTYEEIEKKLGKPNSDARIAGAGLCIWYKEASNAEEAAKLIADGKRVRSITITFFANKATLAVYVDTKTEK